MKAIFIGFVCLIGVGSAAETVTYPLEVGALKAGLRSYEEAKIVGADAIGVKVVHASGTARVPFDQLPDELRNRFNHDRTAAKEQAKSEAESGKAYERQLSESQVMVSLRDDGMQESGEPSPPKRSQSELMRDTIRAEQLQAYVFQLRSGIIRAESKIEKQMLRAQQSQVRSIASSGYYSNRFYRAISRRIGAQIRTLPDQEKIAQAKLLIEYAENEISRLER